MNSPQGKEARPLLEEEQSQLAQYYYEDVMKLQDIVQRDLSHWSPLKFQNMI